MATRTINAKADYACPALDFIAVTPSDTANLANGICRALYVGVTGDLTVVNTDGTAVLFKAAAVGYHPIMTTRVNATGTAATNIVALY